MLPDGEKVNTRRHLLSLKSICQLTILIGGVLLLLLHTGSSAAMDDPWTFDYVDGFGGEILSLDSALDSNGYPHVVYWAQERYLRYAWWNGDEWQMETVNDSGLLYGAEVWVSLTFDANGSPLVIYGTADGSSRGELRYAYRDANGWVSSRIATHLAYGDSDMGLDAQGRLHVAFIQREYLGIGSLCNECSLAIKHAYWDGTSWSIQTVDEFDVDFDYSGSLSMALDSAGGPHVVYAVFDDDTHAGFFKYARWTESKWETSYVLPPEVPLEGSIYVHQLELDSQGRPHFIHSVSANDELRYTFASETGWESEKVGNQEYYFRDASLALQADGRAIISYADASQRLTLARRDEGEWVAEIIDDTGWTQSHSLMLDELGHPKIVYDWDSDQEYGNNSLHYASWNGTAWGISVVAPLAEVGGRPSLALDAQGRQHIGYQDSTALDLKYARRDGNGWHVETVDSEGDVGRHASLAIDGGGNPHIAYRDETNTNLKYAHRDGAGWQIETVDNVSDVGEDISLAVDAAGRPHISYFSYTGSQLKYATLEGAAWRIQVVDNSSYDSGRYTSIALDSAGRPHISYRQHTNGDLRYARWDGSQWHVQNVDSEGDVGGHTSIALDATDQPHIAYQDSTNSRMKYARLANGAWQFKSFESHPLLYSGPRSLALDSEGHAYLSYFAIFTGVGRGTIVEYWDGDSWRSFLDLYYYEGPFIPSLALWANGDINLAITDQEALVLARLQLSVREWQTTQVADDGDVDSPHALVADKMARPHIVYLSCDYGSDGKCSANRKLRYTFWDGDTWRKMVVDSSGAAEASTLALDSDGLAHVTYLKGTTESEFELIHAAWTGTLWEFDLIDSGGIGSAPVSDVDSSDRPHVVYVKDGDLKYARWDGSGWRVETVDADFEYALQRQSFALDQLDRPHIIYTDKTHLDARYAHWTGDHWEIETIDGFGYITSGAIAIGSNGQPHLCYFDHTNHTLKYARLDASRWSIAPVSPVVSSFSNISSNTNSDKCEIEVDAADRLTIAFDDNWVRGSALARLANGHWTVDFLDTSATGRTPIIALDASGRTHLAYSYWHSTSSSSRNDLYYAVDSPTTSERYIYLPAVTAR